ncbi:hypothetical protein ACFXOY_19725 [Streptomyces niveus]|uniref:nSTAND1 domain-containing NTPase n=1 Tax=Streptomyces niveus TaxID=193462 RepID=UPI00369678FD
MPRRELPLAEGGGTVVQFAAALRRLREEAGGPTYRTMAARAHYSVATLSGAAAGHRLPSLDATLAYVRACDGDVAQWEDRWRGATSELSRAAADTATDARGKDACTPYVGLAAYRSDESPWFFGRESVVEELVRRVGEQRLVAVFGASGAGKSSLLRAGLLADARLSDRRVVLFTPGVSPLEELAIQLARPAHTTPGRLHQELTAEPENLHRTLRQMMTGESPDAEVLLVVDQFEELFTLCTGREERSLFVAALTHAASAANSRCRIVLGVRADFYADCAEQPELAGVLRDGLVTLGAMRTEELHRAISEPAIRAGCRVEGQLLTHLIAQAQGQAGVLPLLSHALLETWKRRRGNVLTLAGFRAAGSIEGALSQTAEELYESFAPDRRGVVRHLFLRLTALGEGSEDTKRRVDRTEVCLDGETEAVLQRAAAARLITLDENSVQITHEALIQSWPRLRQWLREGRDQLRVHRDLTDAATTWGNLDQDPGALYRGARLEAARPLAESDDAGLTVREGDFLRASLAEEAAERATAARRLLRRRLLTAAVVLLLLVSVGTSVLAVRANLEVTAERNHAVALNVSATATETYQKSPGLAVQLALTAYRLEPLPESHDALLSTLMTTWKGHDAEMYALDVTPDGKTVITGSRDRTVRLWDVSDPGKPVRAATVTGHRDMVYAVAVHPGGTVMATAGADRTVRLWDIADPRRPAPLSSVEVHTDTVRALAFSPDGRTLASGGQDRTTILWDTRDPAAPVRRAILRGHSDAVRSVDFSRDGALLATAGGDDERVLLWDVSTPAHPTRRATWRAHTVNTFSVAFSSRADVLATSGDGDHPVKLWRTSGVGRPEELAALDGPTDVVGNVDFSPDGRSLAAAGDDRTSRVWDVADPERPTPKAILTGYMTAVLSLRFTADGKSMVSGGFDGTVRVLSTDFARVLHDACDFAGPPITREEWDRYMSGLRFEPPCE